MKVSNNPNAEQISHHSQNSHVHSAKSGLKVSKSGEGAEQSESARPGAPEGDARPEISARGRELAHAKQVATNAPDVREEKIAKLKAMINGGTYKVDPHAIADRMVDEHLSSGIG